MCTRSCQLTKYQPYIRFSPDFPAIPCGMILRTLHNHTAPAYLCTLTGHRIGISSRELTQLALAPQTIGITLALAGSVALVTPCAMGTEMAPMARCLAWTVHFSLFLVLLVGLFRLAELIGRWRGYSRLLVTLGLHVIMALVILPLAHMLMQPHGSMMMNVMHIPTQTELHNLAMTLAYEFVLINWVWVPTLRRESHLAELRHWNANYLDKNGSFCLIQLARARLGHNAN